MNKILITAFLLCVLWTIPADANAQEKVVKQEHVTFKCIDLRNVVKNTGRHIVSSTQKAVDGIGILLSAPFTKDYNRSPIWHKYRYQKPIYIPGKWEKIN
mgnify:CR=1 FL=1